MKTIKRFAFFWMLVLATGLTVYGQQDAQFSQYMFNSIYYNPAFAGVDGLTRMTAIARQQYLGYNTTLDGKGGSPQSFVLSGSTLTPLLNKSFGTGFNFLYDKLGPLTNTQLQVSASYIFRFKSGASLAVGLRGGFLSQRVGANYRVNHEDDEIYQQLNGVRASQLKPDVNFGLVYRTSKYYIGASMSHILKATYSYGVSKDKISSVLQNHLYITGGYNFNLGSMIVLTPTFMIQSDLNQLTYLLGPMATYNDKFWFGINARQSFARKEVQSGGKTLSNDDLVFFAGINLFKNKQNNNAMKIGYAFDFVTSGRRAKSGTSQEILLSYLIVPPWDIVKPKIRTPRYRHDEN